MGDEKLLAKMRASKAGWGWSDLEKLYVSFGFDMREGGKHTVFKHPEFASLRATVARHKSLPVGYIQTALRLIEELKAERGAHEDG